jgi:phosphatidylglycerol:prolipoprotein diacylglycerol transferase
VYECLLEGVLLFIVLQWYTLKERPRGSVSALFLIGYGVARFIVEFFREPEVNDGIIALGWLTKGQALCLPMVILGVGLLFYAKKQQESRF